MGTGGEGGREREGMREREREREEGGRVGGEGEIKEGVERGNIVHNSNVAG